MKNKAVNRLIVLGTTPTILLRVRRHRKACCGERPGQETQTAASQSAAKPGKMPQPGKPAAGENANEDMITFYFSKSSYPSVTCRRTDTG